MSDGDGDCREEKERERREQSKDGDEEWERRGSRDSDKRPVRQMEEDWIRTRETGSQRAWFDRRRQARGGQVQHRPKQAQHVHSGILWQSIKFVSEWSPCFTKWYQKQRLNVCRALAGEGRRPLLAQADVWRSTISIFKKINTDWDSQHIWYVEEG